MIQKLDERVASIIKAMRETEAPVKVKRRKLNPLTRLNNEIVKLQVKDSRMLDFFKDIEGENGYDD